MNFNADPSYPAFPVFSALGFVLVLVPLSWHLQAWNAGTCLYMIWTATACLNLFVNSVVWHENAINWAPVWCDISTRLVIGTAVAIPAASLCINRRLYKIATAHTMMVTRAHKRRAVIEDLSIGLGIPFLQMGLQYIVEGHRFDIYENIGCYPATYNVWPAYVLVAAWPIAIGLTSAVYCILSLRAFYNRRKQFKEFIQSNTSLTVNRYFRLMALATTELICTTPFASYSIYLNLTTETVNPYRGWSDTHFNYSRVGQIPATIWHLNHQTVISIELTRWLVVACALLFFGFFGFAEEARRHYREAYWFIASRLGIRRSPVTHVQPTRNLARPHVKLINVSTNGTLPVFVSRPAMTSAHESLSPTSTHFESISSPSSKSLSIAGHLTEKKGFSLAY